MQDPATKPAKGTVVARKCDCCGHYEGGAQTADGKSIPINPGIISGANGDRPNKFETSQVRETTWAKR